MTQMSFAAFEDEARQRGCETVLERSWPPLHVLPTHAHPFAVHAVVTAGEMWLTVGGATQHLRPGDRFALAADVPHDERYGPDGATYWVGRRGG